MTDAVATNAVTTGTVNAGDHACLTFTDAEERLDLIAAFVRDGLKTGSKVVCWTDTITPGALAEQLAARSVRLGAALRRGQLRLAPVTGALLRDGTDSAVAMVDVLAGELDTAAREGYPGLRVTADMAWATRPLAEAEHLTGFETDVAEL